MAVLIVPPFDEDPWPSLGGQVCDFIEERAVFGPGSLKGEPAKLDDEKRAALWKAYEVYPKGHPRAGRRRFKRVRLSWRKGTAKTELQSWIVFTELHPEGPVRCDGFDASGNPVGRPVRDPYIPMLAFTQEQVSDLAYGALMVICELSPDADLFDIGLDRIIRLDENGRADGKAVPLAGSPNARDGARTTLNAYDETHRLHSAMALDAYTTMEANLEKRPLDDPWSLGVTTAGRPGQGSVAELDKDEAEQIAQGKIKNPQLFYFHRQAGDQHDLKTHAGRVAAIAEATGPVGEFAPGQFEDIARQWERPGADPAYLERTWTNRWNQAGNQAFDALRWGELVRPDQVVPDGANITIGFDGARWRDTAAMIGTEVSSGFQWVIGCWDPHDFPEDEGIPVGEVNETWRAAKERWNVLRTYGDPAAGWDENLADWSAQAGPKRVMFFYTDSRNLRGAALMARSYASAIRAGEVTNDGDAVFTAHIGHTYKREIRMVDDQGVPLWVMTKERHDSPNKIDCAMAGGLSWQARLDAIKAGENAAPDDEYAYVMGF